jgi:hypothetical protein
MPTRRAALLSTLGLLFAAGPATAQVGARPTYEAESAIVASGYRAGAVSRLRDIPAIGVVRLDVRYVPFKHNEGFDVADYKILAQRYRSGIRRLRAALAANPATRKALGSRGIPIGRVVGINIYSSGSIRVYLL